MRRYRGLTEAFSLNCEPIEGVPMNTDVAVNLKKGERLFQDGFLEEAEAVFKDILRSKPDHCEALNNLGVISYSRGALAEAERWFLKALSLEADYQDALANLANLYERSSELKAVAQNDKRACATGLSCSIMPTRPSLDTKPCFQDPGEPGIEENKENKFVKELSGEKRLEESPENRLSEIPERLPHAGSQKLALTRSALSQIVKRVCYFPHPEIRKGTLHIKQEAFESPDRECNTLISLGARLDLTGDIAIGAWTMIGEGTVILTHDHFHEGRGTPLLRLQEERGVKWSGKTIGRDVWLHGCTVLYQVSEIPDGVVVGAGAVLTRNPKPYEIWAGNPARKVGER